MYFLKYTKVNYAILGQDRGNGNGTIFCAMYTFDFLKYRNVF